MTAVDSLWSSEIKPTIQSPRSILENQARAIRDQTNGVLVGDLRTLSDENKKRVFLSLELVVPALENYRHRVLMASHARDKFYPVQIEAEYFQQTEPMRWTTVIEAATRSRQKPDNEASSDDEFRTLVQKVLSSPQVTAEAVSLVARANDVLATRDQATRESRPESTNGDSPPSNGEV